MPILYLQTLSRVSLIVSIALLVLTLIPGLGKEVNGSMRWIQLGTKSFQAAELVKFFIIVYDCFFLGVGVIKTPANIPDTTSSNHTVHWKQQN